MILESKTKENQVYPIYTFEEISVYLSDISYIKGQIHWKEKISGEKIIIGCKLYYFDGWQGEDFEYCDNKTSRFLHVLINSSK